MVDPVECCTLYNDQGYKFMISPDKLRARWCHPTEIPHFYADWS